MGAPGHSWQNTASNGTSIGQKSTIFASKVMAGTVIDLLSDKKLLQRAKDEWAKQMKGREYACPLPADLTPPLDQLKKQPH